MGESEVMRRLYHQGQIQQKFPSPGRHGGAVLIVVLAMTGMLMFLGIFFFSYISVERNSAAWFSLSASREVGESSDYFDFALQQVLIGPRNDRGNSALYGRKWSMIPNMIGSLDNDLHPTGLHLYSGRGINVTFQQDADGQPIDSSALNDTYRFDYDGDGTPDGRTINFSPAANSMTTPLGVSIPNFEPNPGYTYPDINSLFLGHFSFVEDPTNPTVQMKVWIPSYHRPQYLPRDGSPLYTNSTYRPRLLRPHQNSQVAMGPTGSPVARNRYVAAGGFDNALTGATGPAAPFPIPGVTAPAHHTGIWQNVSEWNNIEYDVDADGIAANGKEAILMDLDHRVETLADGTKRMPMYAITIMDADGLLNLNLAGNLLGELDSLAHVIAPTNDRFISQSNLGLTPSELNLGRALYRPLSVAPDSSYQDMFGSLPATQTGISNADVTRLLIGAYDAGEMVAGRWGEKNLLETVNTATPPGGPGLPLGVWNPSSHYPVPVSLNPTNLNRFPEPEFVFGLPVPAGVHPIDPFGAAVDYISSPSNGSSFATVNFNDAFWPQATVPGTNNYGKLRMSRQPGVADNNPSRWPSYGQRWQVQVDPGFVGGMQASTGVGPWFAAQLETPNALQSIQTLGDVNTYLAYEIGRVTVEPALRDLDRDSLFPVSEMQFLHLGNADWTSLATPSRLEKLAKFQFERTDFLGGATSYDDSWWLRSQFTTDSWDRWEFAYSRPVGTQRQWEMNVASGSPNAMFPPAFGSGGSIARFSPEDPFRPEVRQWLTIEHNRTEAYENFPLPQRRLNINRLLDYDENSGSLRERHLTPHPVFVDTDPLDDSLQAQMYQAGTSVVQLHPAQGPGGFPLGEIGTNKYVQEWWAKYDRQRMARDIYVLLYTLGAGDHNFNPTTQVYSEEQCREMAQFAVNVVDALDRDSVITEFVYDIDLTDGWNITGEKDLDGSLVEPQARRVFGVEAQQLAFSETLWAALSNDRMSEGNSPKTPWDDSTGTPIQFLFAELRNISPYDVKYGTGTWRIRRIVGDDDHTTTENNDVTAEFRDVGVIPNIPAGANFWIGSHNIPDNDTLPAAILADVGSDGSYDAEDIFCPSRLLQNPTSPSPLCHLDLCHTDHENFFQGRVAGSLWNASENFLTAGGEPTPTANAVVRLVLERRLNPQGAGVLNNDLANPWVPVDYMDAELAAGPADLFNGGDDIVPSQLDLFVSQERRQPLDRRNVPHPPGMAVGRPHSFGPATPLPFNDDIYNPNIAPNEATPSVGGQKTFTLWQPHFDRDFTSVTEILSVPLAGPEELTEKLAPEGQMSGLNTAYVKFSISDPATGNVQHRNHWYRVLEFLHVPTNVQTHLRNTLPIPRTPGKINLNTVRHPGVLAALVDDDFHLQSFQSNPTTGERFAYGQMIDPHENQRNWYLQFLFSRDRIDPVTELPLPGIPGARPFRPFSFVDTTGTANGRAGVEHTLLRSLPHNGSPGWPMAENDSAVGVSGTTWNSADEEAGYLQGLSRRGLFEARTDQDAGFGGTAVDAVDFHTRQRLLNKIANNTTVRSHLFFCWIYVQFHEAAEDEYGHAQVGGLLDQTEHPPKRAFFVLDRSKLEDAWNPQTRTFDWRKFVVYRKVLQ